MTENKKKPEPEDAAPVKMAAKPALETVKIECLKIATRLVTVNKPPRSIIGEAKEFERYVLGTEANDQE